MANTFAQFSDNPSSPSQAPFAIVPSDTDALATVPKAIYVGTAGDITLRGVAGTADVVFRNLAAGQILPVRAGYVRATGTTAANLIAFA